MFNLFRKSKHHTGAKGPVVDPATKVYPNKSSNGKQQQRPVPTPAPRSVKPSPAINKNTKDYKISKEKIEKGKNNTKETDTNVPEGKAYGCADDGLAASIKELLDPTGTGFVEGRVLKHLLSTLGNRLDQYELGLLSEFEDKDGMIRYDDMLSILRPGKVN